MNQMNRYPVVNVRSKARKLVSTGFADIIAYNYGQPLDAMLTLMLAHGFCRVENYYFTFKSTH